MAITKKEYSNIKAMQKKDLNNAAAAVATALFQKKPGTKSWKASREYLTALQKEMKTRIEDEIQFLKTEISYLDPIDDFMEIGEMLSKIKGLKT